MLAKVCKKIVLLLTVMMLLVSIAMVAPPSAFASNRKPVPIAEESPSLPLRVLTRQMATLYSGPNEASNIVRGNLPTFFSYYVYTRPDVEERRAERGWYEVGSDTKGTTVGWLKSADVFEWKQTMCLIYAHPGMRRPVLMFDELDYLEKLIAKAPAARKTAVKGLYETIESGDIPKDFSVVAIEPKDFIDFTSQPYLLPILEHEKITIDDREASMLQVAAASRASAESAGFKRSLDSLKAQNEAQEAALADLRSRQARLQADIQATRSGAGLEDASQAVAEEAERLRREVERLARDVEALATLTCESSEIRENTRFTQSLKKNSAPAAGSVANELAFDIVWVINTSRNMGSYVGAIRDVIAAVSKQLANDEDCSKRLRFGVWGYRDSVAEVPGLEYLTKNYTPALQNIQDFGIAMSTVKEARMDSGSVPGDMFSGISDAIEKTAWTPGAARILILVSDAPGHELGHRRNASGLDETTARALADRNNITLMAIQIRPQGAVRHQRVAERQFKALSRNPGTDTPAYYSIDSKNLQSFSDVTATLVASLQSLAHTALQEDLSRDLDSGATFVKGPLAGNESLNQALRSAVVRWIGSQTGARAPNEVTAWVVDKERWPDFRTQRYHTRPNHGSVHLAHGGHRHGLRRWFAPARPRHQRRLFYRHLRIHGYHVSFARFHQSLAHPLPHRP